MDTDHIPMRDDRARALSAATQEPEQPKQPVPKQSYESSPEVQRWLQEHAVERDGIKPPFDPTLLSGLRDRDWILSSLGHFYQEELITDVVQVVKSGKEATVFCCAADRATGAGLLAAKVYRPRMFRSLSNDAMYRQGRTQRDLDGRVIRGDRQRGRPGKTGRGRTAQVTSWIEFEFQTQQLLYNAGARVPRAWSHIGNAVLMGYVGDESQPAPHLRQVDLAPEEAEVLFEQLILEIELWLSCDRIHGDLSAYNILYWEGELTIIDFAQAVDPSQNAEVFPLLLRDIERVCDFFARYGVERNPLSLATTLWRRYQGGW